MEPTTVIQAQTAYARAHARALEHAKTRHHLGKALRKAAKRHLPTLAKLLVLEAVRRLGSAILDAKHVHDAIQASLHASVGAYIDKALTEFGYPEVPGDKIALARRLALIRQAEAQAVHAALAQVHAAMTGDTIIRATTSPDPCVRCVTAAGTFAPPYPVDLFYVHPRCACRWLVKGKIYGADILPPTPLAIPEALEAITMGIHLTLREALSGGHWITVTDGEGVDTHLYISHGGGGNGKKGQVIAGPSHLIGANIAHLPKAPNFRTKEHAEGHTPNKATAHPSYTEHQFQKKVYGKFGPGVGKTVDNPLKDVDESHVQSAFEAAHMESREAAGKTGPAPTEDQIKATKAAAIKKAHASLNKAVKAGHMDADLVIDLHQSLDAGNNTPENIKQMVDHFTKKGKAAAKAKAEADAQKDIDAEAAGQYKFKEDPLTKHIHDAVTQKMADDKDVTPYDKAHIAELHKLIDAGYVPNAEQARQRLYDLGDIDEALDRKTITPAVAKILHSVALAPGYKDNAVSDQLTMYRKIGKQKEMLAHLETKADKPGESTTEDLLRIHNAVDANHVADNNDFLNRVDALRKPDHLLKSGLLDAAGADALRDYLNKRIEGIQASGTGPVGWGQWSMHHFQQTMQSLIQQKSNSAKTLAKVKRTKALNASLRSVLASKSPKATTLTATADPKIDGPSALNLKVGMQAANERIPNTDRAFIQAAQTTFTHTTKTYEELYGHHSSLKPDHHALATCGTAGDHPEITMYSTYGMAPSTIIHESGHAIDHVAATMFGHDAVALGASSTHVKMSALPDFQKLYKAYQKTPALWDYMRSNPDEMFAEGYSMYHRDAASKNIMEKHAPSLHQYFAKLTDRIAGHVGKTINDMMDEESTA